MYKGDFHLVAPCTVVVMGQDDGFPQLLVRVRRYMVSEERSIQSRFRKPEYFSSRLTFAYHYLKWLIRRFDQFLYRCFYVESSDRPRWTPPRLRNGLNHPTCGRLLAHNRILGLLMIDRRNSCLLVFGSRLLNSRSDS